MTSPLRPTRRALLLGAAAALPLAGAGAWRLALRPATAGAEGTLTPPEALDAIRAGTLILVDVRRPDEWAATGVPEGATPLDMRRDDFAEALATLRGDREAAVAIVCARGVRSRRVTAALTEAGFARIVDVPEGMLGSAAGPGWLARGLPVVRP